MLLEINEGMTYRDLRPIRCLTLGLATSFLFFACGQSSNGGTPTGTPTTLPLPTIPGGGAPSAYNLEWYAKVSAYPADNLSSTLYRAYESNNVIDGQRGNGDGDSPGVIWRVPASSINSSWVKLTWNSQVQVTQIRLYDNPKADHQITGGEVRFENSIDGAHSFLPVPFEALPDDGATYATVSGPSEPITALVVHVHNHTGDSAGISEIVVGGYRIDESIAEQNITPHTKTSSFSSVLNPYAASSDNGLYKTARVGDGSTNHRWASDGNGSGAYLELEADMAYNIKSITLKDLKTTDYCHFTKARVRFMDQSPVITKDFPIKTSTELSTTLTLSENIISKKFRFEFHDDGVTVQSGQPANCGFSEIEINGSHDPTL